MKTKLRFLFIALALLADVHSAFAQVTNLGIAAAGQQSLIYWPTSSTTNYILQTTASLSSPNWVTASNAVTVNAVTVTNSAPSGYFRLLVLVSTNPPGMVLIPAGSFMIGNSIGDGDITDASPTNVYVSAFYMDTNLVSLSQWQGVYSYATSQGYTFVNAGSDKAANTPVETVDWYDCVKWSNARSQQAGLTPVYYTDAGMTQVFSNTDNGTTVYANWGANGYRLPTEAEWEKAARGGLSGQRFPWGLTISESQANYYGCTSCYSYDLGPNGYNAIGNYPTTSPGTSPVSTFPANGYGLNDMAGNVVEWCWDWYAGPTSTYPAGSPYLGGTDPRGPVGPLSYRVLRGEYWFGPANYARCAARSFDFPTDVSYGCGFRCVRGL
jgi:formylglycine-generating enzyme required for sulfatase activity